MLKALFSRVFNSDPEVNRDRYPRHLYGDWEFIPLDGATLARLYTVPVMEKTFHGKSAEKDARAWVHANMHLVKKEAA